MISNSDLEKAWDGLQIQKKGLTYQGLLSLANRRGDSEAEGRQRLFDKLERFMDSQKAADDEKNHFWTLTQYY